MQVDSVTAIMAEAGLSLTHKKHNLAYATPQTRDVMNFLYQRSPQLPSNISRSSKSSQFSGSADGHTRRTVDTINTLDMVEEQTVVTAQSILDRLVEKVWSAPLDQQPSPNIYMEELFAPEVYQEMLKRLPRMEAYELINHPDARLANGFVTRMLFDLTEDSITRIQPEVRAFWTAMKDVFTSKMLLDAIIGKFRARLLEQFNGSMPEMIAVLVFYKDFPGYFIRVHEDADFKIATMQFYLPEDDSQTHLGTSFHRWNGNGFELLKTNEFKPNSGYAFARTNSSWHSVKVMGERERVRNTLALTIYVKGREYKSPK